jgi:hypothetical protein
VNQFTLQFTFAADFQTLFSVKMSVFQSPIFWLVVIAVLAFIMARRSNRSDWGFKDVVKNPKYWRGVQEDWEQVNSEARAAQNWDDEKVASFTNLFVFEATSSRAAWSEGKILKSLGERTHPIVLGLLRDSSLYGRLVKPTGKDLVPEAPFNRACDLLGDSPGAEAVEVLAPYLNDPSKEIRQDAILSIAKTGAATITPFVRKALADKEIFVRSYALMGLQFALKRSGLSASAQTELFPDVLPVLTDENWIASKAADILYRFNSAKATDYFLSKEVFSAEHPNLHQILKTLANEKISVPRDRLKSLIASLEEQKSEHPKTRALGEALRLLGQQRVEEDREFIRSRMTHPNKYVACGAAEGLLCSFGLEGFDRRILEIEKQSGYESLNEPQRLYGAVFMCDAEIKNGGLAQYFLNSSGDTWREALAGFKAMGFKERFSVLKEAIAKFKNAEPSTDHNIRQDQLSKLYKRNDKIFDALNDRYYKSSEVVEVLATQFVLDNRGSFEPQSSQDPPR